MDARKHFLVVLLSVMAFLATVDAGKYSLMTTRFGKYRYNIAKLKTNYI
jgi:hypothetical protein